MWIQLVLWIVLSSLIVTPATAQDTSALVEGESIRLQTQSSVTLNGRLVRFSRDFLVIELTRPFEGVIAERVFVYDNRMSLALTDVSRIEARRCCATKLVSALTGAKIGGLVGLGVGLLGTAVGCTAGDLDCSGDSRFVGRTMEFTAGRIAFGAVVGAALGIIFPPERWAAVWRGPMHGAGNSAIVPSGAAASFERER